MQEINPEDIPNELTPEMIDILVEMARVSPDLANDWDRVAKVLEQRGQLQMILDKVKLLKQQEIEQHRISVIEEEKKAAEQWEQVLGDRFRSSARNIKPEDIPEELTPEVIDILIEMARAFPDITGEWAAVSKVLEQRGQLRLILDRVQSLERKERELQRASMTEEEKQKEAEQWKKVMDDPEPKFYGNMGEPENAEQYKMKYGHYPPGYESDK